MDPLHHCPPPPARPLLLMLMSLALHLASISSFSTTIALAGNSTSDGSSLLAAMASWNVSLTSWVGTDPCQTQWQGVTCNDGGRVISLNLSAVGLTGPIPQAIGDLEYLEVLDLSNPRRGNFTPNQVSGDLSALASLINLQNLNLSFNPIELETFPAAILKLTNLVALKIDNTRIKGPLPKELVQLTKLEYMYLANNSFTGPLPPEFSNMTHLREMSLWNNNLDSKIPPEYGNLVNLTYINFHECNLYGGLPSEFGKLTKVLNISLYGNRLTGEIPASWNNMTQLYNLWLHRNSLTKYIPQWLPRLPGLFNVSLDYNLFYGSVPNLTNARTTYMSFTCNYLSGPEPTGPANLIFNTSGNCFDPVNVNNKIRCSQAYYDCTTFFNAVPDGSCPSCPSGQVLQDKSTCVCGIGTAGGKSKSRTWILIGSIVGVGAFLLILFFACWIWSRTWRRNSHFNKQGDLSDFWEGPEGIVRYHIQDIVKATDNFSSTHEIGVGGFGKVYYGKLDGKEVAIKRAHVSSIQTSSGFRNEVLLLSRLHHKNLVHLLGFCEDKGVQILVYEYMSNGNLHTMLFKSNINLDWLTRLDIAISVAQGLEYLHSFADPPVIHRDVKPSNVLLDGNMVAKLSDFGISRIAPETATELATKPAGTVGYIDPQYVLREELTTASDVYSYGMVLLELFSGQKAVDNMRSEDRNLIEWTKLKVKTVGIEYVIDPRLGNNYPKDIYNDIIKLAIDCASFDSEDRPSMKAVLTILDACRWAVASQVLDLPSVEDIPEDHKTPKQQHAQYSVQRNQSVDGSNSALDHSIMTNNTLMSGR